MTLVKESTATSAAPEVMPSPEDVDARHQEVSAPLAGLTLRRPALPRLLRSTSLRSPQSFLRLRFLLPWRRGRLLPCPARGRVMVLLLPPGPWKRQGRRWTSSRVNFRAQIVVQCRDAWG